jgi:hypothetical protein
MVLKTQDNKIPMAMDEFNEDQARQLINAMLERFPALTDSFKKFGDAAKKGSAEFKKEADKRSRMQVFILFIHRKIPIFNYKKI